MKETRIILLIIIFAFLLVLLSCAPKQSFVIGPPPPRTIVVPIDSMADDANSIEYFDAKYPDQTLGYIKNNAFPCVPKVWYIEKGRKKVLIGPDGDQNPPEFLYGEIREFRFPPGKHVLHVERWQELPPYYGGWRKDKRIEVVDLEIKIFTDYWRNQSYGWAIIIGPAESIVYY